MVIKVVHITTAHARGEVRVFLKECLSLSNYYEMHLIVADGLGDATVRNVWIHDAGIARGRFQRMLVLPWRILVLTLRVRARLYHLHEPELLLIALFLRLTGARVVYDSHEDVPRAIMSRDWIRPSLRRLVSAVFEKCENFVARRISAVIGATPHIAKRFSSVNKRSVAINNYPLTSEMASSIVISGNERTVCYIGGISRNRGIFEMVRALEFVDARLILAGPFDAGDLQSEVRMLPGWARVDYRGVVSREEVVRILAQSQAGLLLFHPEPNHIDAQPNKMFEYMGAGLPVIASNFPLWRQIIVGAQCGVLVDPLNAEAIADAIRWMLEHSDKIEAMGERGRKAVEETYNWKHEEIKLIALYEQLLPS